MDAKSESDFLSKKMRVGNKFDKQIIRSIPGIYGKYIKSFKKKRVLDIGGHIGGFTVYAAHKGATSVVTVEPLPRNFKLLKANTSKYKNCKCLKGAAVRKLGTTRWIVSGAMRSTNENANFGNNDLREEPSSRGVPSIQVKSYKFKKLVDDLDPHIIKMDCEGSEYELLKNFIINPSLEMLLVEIHFFKEEQRKLWKKLKPKLEQSLKIVAGRQKLIEGIGRFGTIVFERKE